MSHLQVSSETVITANGRALRRATARAVRSIRECAVRNLHQAKTAKAKGYARLQAYHLEVALSCRRDANSLLATDKP